MEFLYIFGMILLIIFSACTGAGVVRFFIDTRKYSSLKQELKTLLEKARAVDTGIEECKKEEGEGGEEIEH